MEYHLSIADKNSGPFSQFTIIERIRNRELTGEELIWRKGFDQWIPLKAADDFASYWPISEETLIKADEARQLARIELDTPQPWLRLWARVVDLACFFICAGMIVGSALPADFSEKITTEPARTIMFLLGMMMAFTLIEAFSLSRSGTTLGKALLRIQVRRKDGKLPTLRHALQRSAIVSAYTFIFLMLPMPLGILPIILLAWWFCTRLTRTRTTPWDEASDCRVEHGEPEAWRYLVLGGIVLMVMAGITLAVILAYKTALGSAGNLLP